MLRNLARSALAQYRKERATSLLSCAIAACCHTAHFSSSVRKSAASALGM
jgi:hypothetical protein